MFLLYCIHVSKLLYSNRGAILESCFVPIEHIFIGLNNRFNSSDALSNVDSILISC